MKKQQLEVCVTLIGLFQLLVSGLVLEFENLIKRKHAA
jgi:hypothetical protein